MAWTSGFFNSNDGDRLYTAEQLSAIFNGLITDGVYQSVGNKLAVQPNSGMAIQINTGRGWFGGHWVDNDSPYVITLEDSDVTLNRYAAICIKSDSNFSVRTAEPYVKYSDFATTPVKPTVERSELIKEYCLAYVYIKAGATVITSSNITDTRADTELCGWVTGLIDQVDSGTLWEQWDSQFNDWFDKMKDQLSEDAAGNLQVQLDEKMPISGGTFTGPIVIPKNNAFTFMVDEDNYTGILLALDDNYFYVTHFLNGAWIGDILKFDYNAGEVIDSKLMPKSGGNFTSQSIGLNNGTTQIIGTDSYSAVDVYFTDTDNIDKFARLMFQNNGNLAVEIWKADTSVCYSRYSFVTQAGGSFKGEMWVENPVSAARTNLKNISILNSDWSAASGNNTMIRMIRK